MDFEVVDEVRHLYSTFVFLIQKLRFSNGADEIRFGYYVVGKVPSVKGRWVWGQFAPILPPREFKLLIGKARSKGWV
jgi:hypothetical protein